MKQTNSAIKYLVAQYRAIFKHAYFKGLVSAVALTAGLSSGVTAAGTPADLDNSTNTWAQAFQNANTVKITGSQDAVGGTSGIYRNLNFGVDASTSVDPFIIGKDQVLSIEDKTSANTEANSITVSGSSAVKISGTGSLVIDLAKGEDKYNRFKLVAGAYDSNGAATNSGSIEVDLGTIDLKAGDFILKSVSGNSSISLNAKTITIGDGTADRNANKDATLHLNEDTDSGAIVLGDTGSTLTINKNGKVRFSGKETTTALEFKPEEVQVNGGILVFAGSGSATIKSHTIDFDGGVFEIQNNFSGATVELAAVSGTSGSLTFDGSADNKASVRLGKALTINQGVVTFGENSELVGYNDSISGAIVLGDGSDANNNKAVLNISAENLYGFLNAKDNSGNSLNYADATSGSVLLQSGSTLNFTNDVDLADYYFSSGSNTEAGKIVVDETGLITGENISVSQALSKTTSNAGDAGVDAVLNIEATNLTLGSTGFDSSKALGFASATAKNVEFVAAANDTFVLKDAVTLRSTRTITSSNGDIEVSDNGQIIGDVIVSGTLTVDGGKYSSNNDFAISSGNLTVVNNDKLDESSLTLSNLTIDLSDATPTEVTILADGKLGGENDPTTNNNMLTKLDLSNGFTMSGDKGTATLEATSGAVVILNADSVQKSLNIAAQKNNQAAQTPPDLAGFLQISSSSGGKLVINDDIELNYNSGNAASLNKALNVDSGGILEIDGELAFNVSGAWNPAQVVGYSTEKGGIVRAQSLNINNQATLNGTQASDTYLDGGTFELSSGLTVNTTNFILGNAVDGTKTVELNLKTNSAADSGSISTTNFELQQGNITNTTTLNIEQGSWSASNTTFKLTSGSMTIGDRVDNDTEFTTASLNANGLVANSGSLAVKSGSSGTFNTFTLSGADITVNGVLNINGKHTPSGSGVTESWGVDIDGGTINVAGKNASLNFGSTAVENISLSGTSVVISGDTFTNNIVLSSFGTLKLDFANKDGKMNFSADALADLRQTFISGSNGEALKDGFIDLGKATIDKVNVSGDGTISWNELETVSDIIADIKNDDLSSATLTDVDSNDLVKANVGNIQASGSTTEVNIGKATLNQANKDGYFAVNENGEAVKLNVVSDGSLIAYNGGKLADVVLTGGNVENTTFAIVSSGDAVTSVKSISVTGTGGTLVEISGITNVEDKVTVGNLNVDQALTVTNEVKLAGDLTSSSVQEVGAGKITATNLTVSGDTHYAGSLDIADEAVFEGEAYLGGVTNEFKGKQVKFKHGADLDRGVTTAKEVILGGAKTGNSNDKTGYWLNVKGYGHLIANSIKGESDHAIYLSFGEDSGAEGNETWDDSAGNGTIGTLHLNGGILRADPDFNNAASIVAVDNFYDANAEANNGNDAGTLNGQIIALRNSIVGIGVDATADQTAIENLKATFSTYLDANGSLSKDGVGAIVYVAEALDVDASTGSTSKIVVDSSKSFTTYDSYVSSTANPDYQKKINDNNIYLGSKSVLAISDKAALDSYVGSGQRSALHFDGTDSASLYAEKNAKIVLVGDDFSTRDEIMLFTDDGNTDDNKGIEIKGNDLTVETINGLLSFTLEANTGKDTIGGHLSLNEAKIDSAFTQASAPVKYSLISYAADDNNWEYQAEPDYQNDKLHGAQVNNIKYVNGQFLDNKDNPVEDQSAYTTLAGKDGKPITDGNGKVLVYREAYNYFLDNVIRNSTTGLEAEQAARLSIYGGTAQAALSAGATTYDAISGRMGVGAQYGSITFADNGQGAGLWVSPIYKSHDSDGFGAQGPSYGVDMSMYGLALGGDFTMANGLRIGGAFNLGSGDADGQGVGAGVSNDFDYVGFALYAGFSMDNLSVIGDVSYTMVDNDVKANTSIEQISASMDSSNLSVGITGQYALDFNGLSVVPHAGLRYTSVDMDDYTVKGSADIAYYGADSFNVFSIPVGVTVAKDITAGSWTIKPAFDLTLTANMGDDSVGGTVAWAGIENLQTNVESEVVDSFTYGATLGVSAKSGNMSLGFGVNYTGASSADEYGIQANARFVF